MGWLLEVLLVLGVLLIGVLLALILIGRQERAVRLRQDHSAGASPEPAEEVAAPAPPPKSPGPHPVAQLWSTVLRPRGDWLVAQVGSSWQGLRRRAAARFSPPEQSERADAGRPLPQQQSERPAQGGAPSWQEQRGRPAMQHMIKPEGRREKAPAKTPAHQLNQPVFSRPVLFLLVLLVIAALFIIIWRANVGRPPPGPPPPFTILIATLPGSTAGQSSAELLAQLQEDLAAAGLPPTLTLQVIPEQPTSAASAYALATARRSDLLIWGYVRPDIFPGYFLTLTVTPRFHGRLAPEFPEYGLVMATPPHFALNRAEGPALSPREVAQVLTWVARFYTGRFELLESLPPAAVQGNAAAEVLAFHWLALHWLKGDYAGAKAAYAALDCAIEFAPTEMPLSPRPQAERQLCLAAANNWAATLLAQESLGLIPASSLDPAATALAEVVRADPALTIAWHNLGRVYLARGRWNEAVRALEQAVEQTPEVAARWAALSEACIGAGDLPRAREAAAQAERLDGRLAAAYLAQGLYLLAIDHLQDAERVLDQALQLAEAETMRRRSRDAVLREGPQPNPGRADFAAAWARRNDAELARVYLARARVFLRQAEHEGQAPFLLWVWRGIIGESSPLDKAETEVQKALTVHPDWSAVLRVQAKLLMANGYWDEAVQLLRTLQEQDPHDLGVYLELIQVLEQQWRRHQQAGRTAEAARKLAELRAEYQLLIDLDVAPAQGYFGLGDVAQRIGEWEPARQAYLQAIGVEDDYAEAYLRLGQVELYGMSDEAQALFYLDRALEFSAGQGPVAITAYCERGEILLEQHLRLKATGQKGPVAEAAAAFEAARALVAGTARALNGLGRIAYDAGDVAGAERLYRQALALEPRNLATLYGLGRVYGTLARHDVARDYLVQAAMIRSDSIAVRYHLGIAYHTLLDKVLARQNLEWVQQKCETWDPSARQLADDREACAGVEGWLARISEGR